MESKYTIIYKTFYILKYVLLRRSYWLVNWKLLSVIQSWNLTPYLIVSQSVVPVSLIEVISHLFPFQNMVKELYPQWLITSSLKNWNGTQTSARFWCWLTIGVPSCSNQTGVSGLVVTALIKLLIFISTLEGVPSFELDVLKSWAYGAITLLILMLSRAWNPSKKVVRLVTGLVYCAKIKLVKENNTQKSIFFIWI